MTNKKGISLIVLIITIIVIIILAGAVILSLNNTNIIANSNQAVLDSDKANIQSAVTLFLTNKMIDSDTNKVYKLKIDVSTPTAIPETDATGITVTRTNGTDTDTVKLSFESLGISKPKKGVFKVDDQGNVTATAN